MTQLELDNLKVGDTLGYNPWGRSRTHIFTCIKKDGDVVTIQSQLKGPFRWQGGQMLAYFFVPTQMELILYG